MEQLDEAPRAARQDQHGRGRGTPFRAMLVSAQTAFDAIGTRWLIDTEEPLSAGLRASVLERTRDFDATYSRFRPDSLVSRIAAAPEGGRFRFPDDSIVLFRLYDRLGVATDGALDPLVGRALELLGYDAEYSLTPAPDAVRARENRQGRAAWATDVVRDGTVLVTRRPLVIDVGAAGKGYLVDLIAGMLREAGVDRFVVDASGDLLHAGRSVIRVGLEHPFNPHQVIGVANLRNRALCASAVTRRAWGDGLHHVLDARTGSPVTDVVATWVVADETVIADGLATALFFTDPRRLAETFRFTYVRMHADGRAEYAPDFDGELFTTSEGQGST